MKVDMFSSNMVQDTRNADLSDYKLTGKIENTDIILIDIHLLVMLTLQSTNTVLHISVCDTLSSLYNCLFNEL